MVFSTLQGVQDNLDDPFDGMGEDDIKVEMMDEWTCILQNMDPTSTKYSGERIFLVHHISTVTVTSHHL